MNVNQRPGAHFQLWFISSTGLTFKQLEQAVQYKYRQNGTVHQINWSLPENGDNSNSISVHYKIDNLITTLKLLHLLKGSVHEK